MILEIHNCPEGALIQVGFNLEESQLYTEFRLIYRRSNKTGWYFRIRSAVNEAKPKYIFNWEN